MPSVIGVMVRFFYSCAHTIDLLISIRYLARDYIEGMWLMLQQESPEDFVLATGETHPVREYVEKAFAQVGVQLKYVFSFVLSTICIDHQTPLPDGPAAALTRKREMQKQER
jgi:hypothetical protein